ncbi:MAG: DNA (cytosine-5-)-methyltransferase [Epulopiscium sp. Nele67-Bin001]|nr:MAG: DNA (cytosine-5-)-methyltransferase [Epulopiscium sp. Nele67-Bin001]
MKNLTCASFFAGVGGIDIAFEEHGFNTIYANEIDALACKTFEHNFDIKVDNRDINVVNPDEIPDFDIMLGGFPCQAFSLAGYRQGFEDEKGRGTLFFELRRILKKKKPTIIFLENVKNLVGHDNGNTFRIILEKLEEIGYYVKYQVLNAMEYGDVPQNRERIYIIGFKNKSLYQKFEFPKPIELKTSLSNVINYRDKVEDKYYYTSSCSFYDKLVAEMKSQETVYQWRRVYVRENKNNVCPTLTANMGTGGHNVPLILTNDGIRKLTPKECFNIQGFPTEYILPTDTANTHLYKQAGNSVVVPVISRIAANIKSIL